MAWTLKNGGAAWSGETHTLGATTYSGKTRTPASKPLVWVDEKPKTPKPSSSMQKPAKKKPTPSAKRTTAWD
jgi:hypothetical protein